MNIIIDNYHYVQWHKDGWIVLFDALPGDRPGEWKTHKGETISARYYQRLIKHPSELHPNEFDILMQVFSRRSIKLQKLDNVLIQLNNI